MQKTKTWESSFARNATSSSSSLTSAAVTNKHYRLFIFFIKYVLVGWISIISVVMLISKKKPQQLSLATIMVIEMMILANQRRNFHQIA